MVFAKLTPETFTVWCGRPHAAFPCEDLLLREAGEGLDQISTHQCINPETVALRSGAT